MLLAPGYQGREGGHQRLTRVGQRIFYTRRYLRKHLAMHQMAPLQVLQRLREHLLRTVCHQLPDFVETQHARLALVEHEEHQHRPLVAETTDDLPDGTGQIFNVSSTKLIIK